MSNNITEASHLPKENNKSPFNYSVTSEHCKITEELSLQEIHVHDPIGVRNTYDQGIEYITPLLTSCLPFYTDKE